MLRKDRAGRYYLDLFWPDLRLVVEVDGIHHTWAENVGDASARTPSPSTGTPSSGSPLLGLRLEPEAFFAQIEHAMRAAGWTSVAA